MKVIQGVYRDMGERRVNEDTLICEVVRCRKKRAALCAVLDGIGGLSEGEVAGGYAGEQLLSRFLKVIVPMINEHRGIRRIRRSITDSLYYINEGLKTYGREKGISLGTTVSCLYIIGRRYIAVNIGDSQIYLCRGNRLNKLFLPDRDREGNVRCCVGSFPFRRPKVRWGFLRRNTGFLVCSDGFYNVMSTSDGFFAPYSMQNSEIIEQRLRKMGDYVKKQGEKDNASAVYLKVM